LAKKNYIFFLIFRKYFKNKRWAQSSLAQGSKGCVQSDYLDKFLLLRSMVILCVEMKKNEKNEDRQNKGKMMKEKNEKKTYS
jgi:hypothetical protein